MKKWIVNEHDHSSSLKQELPSAPQIFQAADSKKVRTELCYAQNYFQGYFLIAKLIAFLFKTCFYWKCSFKTICEFYRQVHWSRRLDCLGPAEKFLVWTALVAFGNLKSNCPKKTKKTYRNKKSCYFPVCRFNRGSQMRA